MSEVEDISEKLPPKDEYDPEEASDGVITLTSMYDLREIGILKNGEPEDGEQTWYLSETGKAWVEGEIELDLEELARNEDVSEDDLYGTLDNLKEAEQILQMMSYDSADDEGGESQQ
ncbi:hypothetical protein [Natrinema sp. H-ect4]|uniref:hypothetical protein n=1 Tax=Natrinema sp. H-ect4 TaxID=3242699 RepID=UPI0035A825CC